MSNQQDHINFIKGNGDFQIDCNLIIFSLYEIEILRKYGHWFKALCEGTLQPITDMQHRFIQVANGEFEPFRLEEKAWFKYLGRKKVEAKFGNSLYRAYRPEEDSFYNREMVKKQRQMMSSEVWRNHRS